MFDGVGGFIHGLNDTNNEIGKDLFDVVYSNQFEPSRKFQDAFEVGVYQFPDNMTHIPTNVMDIEDSTFQEMKNDGVNMIVGGFPCQDYSVARSKKGEQGIQGKKVFFFGKLFVQLELLNQNF